MLHVILLSIYWCDIRSLHRLKNSHKYGRSIIHHCWTAFLKQSAWYWAHCRGVLLVAWWPCPIFCRWRNGYWAAWKHSWSNDNNCWQNVAVCLCITAHQFTAGMVQAATHPSTMDTHLRPRYDLSMSSELSRSMRGSPRSKCTSP